MRIDHLLLAAAAVTGFAGAASAGSLTVTNGFTVSPRITYTSAAAVNAGLTGGSYTGVGTLFVSTRSTQTTNLGYVCTGSLLSSNVVVTAGHCLSDYGSGSYDPVASVSFYLPSRSAPVASFTASSWLVSPTFDPANLGGGGDYALFTLGTQANGFDTYSIFDGDPLQQFTRVGTGSVGGPNGTGTGDGVVQDRLQRSGTNLFEHYGDLVQGWSGNILLSDFDDGTDTHDVFGVLLGENQVGIPGESNSSPGDSGGPEFIGGRIASVTSFGISGDAFTGECGTDTSIDPVGPGGTTGETANLLGCTNSSVGELAGDTWLLPYRDFITAYVSAAAAPEPASWAMMIAGFGMAGTALRRRRRPALA